MFRESLHSLIVNGNNALKKEDCYPHRKISTIPQNKNETNRTTKRKKKVHLTSAQGTQAGGSSIHRLFFGTAFVPTALKVPGAGGILIKSALCLHGHAFPSGVGPRSEDCSLMCDIVFKCSRFGVKSSNGVRRLGFVCLSAWHI